MKAKQKDFFEGDPRVAPRRLAHGGEKSNGVQKIARPLDRKKPVHLVLKSSHAKARLSMLSFINRTAISRILNERAKQFAVKIHGFENMGNHLHIVASFQSRKSFQNFLRTVTALIARYVTGARRGRPFGKRFWDHLAFTRVVTGFKDFKGLKAYLQKNDVERELGPRARGEIEKQEIEIRKLKLKSRLKRLRPTPHACEDAN